MATLLPLAEQQFLDGDGMPLVGGQVFFYVPGTTAFKDTWQDPGGQTLNQNPVILDGSGRAVIYGVGAYRQVVKDADLDVIWDQVTADTASSQASWAGTAGGTANNLVLTAANFASVDGQAIDFIADFANTGPIQATVNGTAVPVKIDTVTGPVQTPAGCTAVGNRYRLTYDATAGLLHLTPVVDRGYVDGEDQSILAQAIANTGAQVASGVSTAESYAASAAASAQAAAISTAESYAATAASNAQAAAAADATAKANAAQNAATSAAEGYAQNAANNAQNAAQSFASNADNTVTANANAYAASQATNAYNQACSYAAGQAAAAQSTAENYAAGAAANAVAQAKNYTDGTVAQAQSSNASTYVQGVRLSGPYTAALAGVQPGSVCIGAGGGSQANYAYLQTNVNGQWATVSSG